MKIALVFPPLYGVDLPPLGLAYVAGQLRADSHEVKVFCFNSRLYRERVEKRFLWDWENSNAWLDYDEIKKNFDIERILGQWVRDILDFTPDAVGFSVNTHSRLMADLLSREIKSEENRVKIIYGGPFCSEGLSGKENLSTSVDIYVKGEGERSASTIFKRLARQEPLTDIPGIIFKENGTFYDSGDYAPVVEIDEIPFPALDLFDFSDYDNTRDIPIIFSRGCNYYCRFCCDRPMWGRYRMRSAVNIVEEMKRHKIAFGRAAFKCNDLLVNGDLIELERLAELLIKENLNITWGGMARARADMNEGLVTKLKKAGCEYLTFGIESGSERILKFMGKPGVKEGTIALRRTHNAGIKVNTLWLVGHPRETQFDLIKTMFFLFKNRRSIDEFVNVSPCYIPKNSLLHKQSENLGIAYDTTGNWYIKDERNTLAKRSSRVALLERFASMLGLYTGGIRSDY